MWMSLHFSIFIPGFVSEKFNNITYFKFHFSKLVSNFYITQLDLTSRQSLLKFLKYFLKGLY